VTFEPADAARKGILKRELVDVPPKLGQMLADLHLDPSPPELPVPRKSKHH
jgi:hypothetical protein